MDYQTTVKDEGILLDFHSENNTGSQTKTCKQCGEKFDVTENDLKFYKKISPTFVGKTFNIPVPTLCPECRQKRRLSFRNDFKIYKSKSSLSGESILSIYSPDKSYRVYSNHEWWSDKWDPLSYGQDYNPNESFFSQFSKLLKKVPRLNLYVDNLCEKCDFSNQISSSKGCYLVSSAVSAEKCMYSFRLIRSKDCLDSLFLVDSELCYECIDLKDCYGCRWCQESSNCRNSYFLFDCVGCSNCIMCQGLRDKNYYYRNEEISKEEFVEIKKEIETSNSKKIEQLRKEFNDFKINSPVKYSRLINTENVTGHNIENAKDCYSVFDGTNIDNCSYSMNINDSKDCYDVNFGAANTILHLEVVTAGIDSTNVLFSSDTWPKVVNLIYCDSCSNNTTDCFGCVGLRHKKYCILNKQYTKEEYEKKVAQIIEKMIVDKEWGEFFPIEMSPFCYNESVADVYYPLSKEKVEKISGKWLDIDYTPTYSGEIYKPKENIYDYLNDEVERKKLLKGIIKCEVSGKPFKILPQELAFYLENRIPIPVKHYDIRLKERFALRNPRKLYHRECMCEEQGHDHYGRCSNEFETTYAPERSEKVYCESCYQKSVI